MRTSESIKEISSALCKFQEEVTNPKKDSTNPYFKAKYSTLDTVINAAKPILAKNGLSFFQSVGGDGHVVAVTTLLMHSSGEWIESDPLILNPVKTDPQGAGSAITYARRYALSAILGLASEDDDDGNSCSNNAKKTEKVNTKLNTEQKENLSNKIKALAAEGKSTNKKTMYLLETVLKKPSNEWDQEDFQKIMKFTTEMLF